MGAKSMGAAGSTTSAKLWELARLTRAVATSLDYDLVLDRVTDAARRLLDADEAALAIEGADGVVRIASGVGLDPARAAAFGAPLNERIAEHLTTLFAHRPGDRFVAVPLVDRDAVRGLLAVHGGAAGQDVAEHEALLSALADHAVVALHHAQHVGHLERDRRRASDIERLLAEAAVVLASSLDSETTLTNVARLAVGTLADRCIVDLVEPDLSIRRVVVAAADPAADELSRRLYRFPPTLEGAHPVSEVLRTGRTVFAAEVDDARLASIARGPEHLALLRALGLASYICVPLVARERTLGTLWLASARPDRRYSPEDVAVAEEIARRASLAVDNARLYAEAQEAVRARDAFLARASHELRTPLTSALGTVRLLQRALAGGSKHAPEPLVSMAARSLEAMSRLVNDLLDVSKLAAGGDEPPPLPVDVATLVTRGLEIVAPQAQEKGVAVRVSVPEGAAALGDAERLEQVLVNLLGNAVKFTPGGGEVEVEARPGASHLTLSVRDTGEGIPREHLESIFQPFFRADRRGGRQRRGTGLGLSICRQIVTAHGGRIWAESAGLGQGSAFVVELPSRASGEARAAVPPPRRPHPAA